MGKSIKLHKILYPIIFLLVIAVFLGFERNGISVNIERGSLSYLPTNIIENKKEISTLEKECVILTSSEDEYADSFCSYMEYILDAASVGYDVVDISNSGMPELTNYRTAVCVISDLNIFDLEIFTLTDWVRDGGRVLFFNPLIPTSSLLVISNWLSIDEGGMTYTPMTGLKITSDFMIGSENLEYSWEDPILMLDIGLSSKATVHIRSDKGIPILWETDYGEGKFVVNTFPSTQKDTRGITLASYSLLEDEFSYPVINASTFFIDDFPAPIPNGYNEYITKFYNRDISSFMTNIWWPDMLNLSKKYGLKYTGLVIEQYTKETIAPFDRYGDLTSFIYFGSMLLDNGGQLGYHGYNHQPLVFGDFDYKNKLNYQTWKSETDVIEAFDELTTFTKMLFPEFIYDIYVPPSNILSDEGRKLLVANYPQIKTFSGIYIKEDIEYEQEFCIDEDGIINLPRIISGTSIDTYSKWLAFNELNFHYINSHFIHPDDALDPDRGAEVGWEMMRNNFEEYIGWLYDSAPNIRNLSATDTSKAIQRYATIRVSRKTQGDKYIIDIDNFYDEAYLMIRIREGEPVSVVGGGLDKLSNELYMLTAVSDHVEIKIEK
ncbi:MAG: hypothetical protein A2Y17_03540 [Clostridiales bacterium GWF2_38_85]|nr:MAG: hypothetical protein A2Y17_03540 [Clostridiales bacterium GWF2_38_85]HBL85281.1 DUF2194 domain-containing protein [Clostridiales bacterium]